MNRKQLERTKAVKLMNYDASHKVYCKNQKCSGHGVVFRKKGQERKLCPNCNEWIYKDEKTRLKYEMLERGVNIEKLK